MTNNADTMMRSVMAGAAMVVKPNQKKNSAGGTTARAAETQDQKRRESYANRTSQQSKKFSEEIFNKTPGMERQWGSYRNYLYDIPGDGSYFSRPQTQTMERAWNSMSAFEAGLKRAQQVIETAEPELDRLSARLKQQSERVATQYGLYSGGNNSFYATYQQAVQEYDKMYQEYASAFAASQAAREDYSRLDKRYNEEKATFEKESSVYDDWRKTVRAPEESAQEMVKLDASLRSLEDEKRLLTQEIASAPRMGMGTSSADQRKRKELLDAQITHMQERREKLVEENDWAQWFKWDGTREQEGFEQGAEYEPRGIAFKKNGLTDVEKLNGFDLLYEAVNGNEDAAELLRQKRGGKYTDSFERLWNESTNSGSEAAYLTENEKAIFNYLAKTEGDEKAQEYYDYITSDLNARQRAKEEEDWRETAQEHPVASSLFSVAMGPWKGLGYLAQASELLTNGKIDQNAGYNKLSYTQSAIRGQVGDMISRSGTWGPVGSFGYQTGMSMADFLTNLAITGGGAGGAMSKAAVYAIMGSSAAADATMEAKDRGLSDAEAFGLGTVAGAAEIVTEQFSVEALLEGVWEKNAIKYVLKNAFTEGTEEVASDLINLMADALIAKDKSKWNTAIAAYRKEGMTQKKAFLRAFTDQLEEMGLDFAGGALSGGLMAGVEATRSIAGQAIAGKKYTQVGEMLRKEGDETIDILIEEAQQQGGNVAKIANDLKERMENGKNITDKEIGILYGLLIDGAETKAEKKDRERNVSNTEKNVNIQPESVIESPESVIDTQKNVIPATENVKTSQETTVERPTEAGKRWVNLMVANGQDVTESYDTKEEAEARAEYYNKRFGQKAILTVDTREAGTLDKARRMLTGNTMEATAEKYNVPKATQDRVARIAKLVGREVAFYEGRDGENGKYTDGSGVLMINAKSENPVAQILSHELTHSIEGWDNYGELQGMILKRMEQTGINIDAARNEIESRYERYGVKPETDKELVAEFVERNLLTDEQTIRQMVQGNRSFGTKIMNAIDGILAKLGSKAAQERTFLLKTREMYAKALQETTGQEVTTGKTTPEIAAGTQKDADYLTQIREQLEMGEITEDEYDRLFDEFYQGGTEEEFSIARTRNMPWKKQIEGYFKKDGSIKSSDSLYIGESEGILDEVKKSPLYIPTSVITKATRAARGSRSAHELKKADIMRVKKGIKNAPAVIYNPARNALIYVTDNQDANGNYIIAAFDMDNDLQGENAHKATSIYGRTSIASLLKSLGKDAVVFVKNVNKLNQMLPGNQIYRSLELLAKVELVDESITGETKDVNQKFSLSKPVEQTRTLLALHNMDEEKLWRTLKLGAWPSPSIAIVKAEQGHENYGAYSAVFPRSVIDPEADSRNKVYGSDAWTPTHSDARVDYEVDYSKMRELEKHIAELSSKVAGGAFVRDSIIRGIGVEDMTDMSADDIAKKLASRTEVKAAYLADKGMKLQPEYRTKEYDSFGNKTLQAYIDKVGAQNLASIIVDMETSGGDIAIAEREMDEVCNSIVERWTQERANSLNSKPELRQKRIDAYRSKITVGRVDAFLRHAWEFYEDGGTKTDEIDRMGTSAKLNDAVSDAEAERWIRPQLNGMLGEPGIYNGKDRFTAGGKSRSFAQLHYPYTVDNLVKAMNQATERGQGVLGASATGLLATATPSYGSVGEIHADEGRLQAISEEEYNQRKSKIDAWVDRILSDITRTTEHHADNTYEEHDIIGGIIMEAASGRKTEAAILRAFAKEGYAITKAQANEILSLYNTAANIETGYFEAKPKRVVAFEEAAAVVAPDDAPENLLDAMRKAGMNVLEYQAGDEKSRLDVINGLGTQFSISRTGDGKAVAVIDDDILSNIDTSSWDNEKKEAAKKAAKNALLAFKNGIQVNGITYKVNKKSRDEYTRSNDTEKLYRKSKETFSNKLRAAQYADDIITATTDWAKDGMLDHPRTDRMVDFLHGNVLIKAGENKYSADTVVGIQDDGKYVFYDVTNMKPTNFTEEEESPTAAAGKDAASAIQGDSSTGRLTENGMTVKQKFSLSKSNKQETIQNLRKYMAGDMSTQEIREYLDGNVMGGGVQLQTYGQIEARNILREAHRQGLGVEEYIRQNWEQFEYDGEMNESAREAVRMERKGTRYSASETEEEKEEGARAALNGKATKYLKGAERALTKRIGETLSLPASAKRDFVRQAVRDMSEEYLRDGTISDEKMNKLFETAYQKGVVVNEEFYNQYKGIKDYLRKQAVTISEQDKSDIADYGDFKKRAWGTLRIVNEGGLPVDSAYMELREMAPELFPEDIMHPADRLARMYEVGKSIKRSVESLEQHYGQEAEDFKRDAKREFLCAVEDMMTEIEPIKKGEIANTEPKSRKERDFLERKQRELQRNFMGILNIPNRADGRFLKSVVDEISEEYINDGRVTQETIDRLFEEVYQKAPVAIDEFFRKNEKIKDYLRTTAVTISKEDQGKIKNYDEWEKQSRGKLNIVQEGGTPVGETYAKLRNMAPMLFPEYILDPAKQLMRMRTVEITIWRAKENLKRYYGKDAEEFKKIQKNDFRCAIDDMIPELRSVRAKEQEITQAEREKGERTLTTLDDVKQAHIEKKEARRRYEKARARNVLTDAEEIEVGRLLRGEILVEHLDPQEVNIRAVKEVYEAKKEFELLSESISEWNKRKKKGDERTADGYLSTAREWKDKKSGFQYARETQERNAEDIIPKKYEGLARRYNAEYFEPIHKAQANATRMKNEYRQRVREMNLSTKETKAMQADGRVSEAHAVQLIGEALDNIRMLEQSRGRIQKRDGRTLDEWRGIMQDMWEKNPQLDKGTIITAIEEFRSIYDELYEQMNEVRIRNGYDPINYRKGYFPHFQPGESGILSLFGKALGIDVDVQTLPTSINGLTHAFKPGIQWNAHALTRQGYETAYDAVEGFDRYIEGVADIICQTDNIQKLRALANRIRYWTTNDGMREKIDAIRADEKLTDIEKKAALDDLYKNGKYTLGNYVVDLEEYTNLLANKKSSYDRKMEEFAGRKFYTVAKNLESQIAKNMVTVNVGSWLTNFIPLTQAWGMVSSRDMLAGMWQTMKSVKTSDGFYEQSAFLTNRRGSDPLVQAWTQRTANKLASPMEWIDTFTSESIVRARYQQNMRRGMSEQASIDEADAFAAGVLADRSKGSQPTMFAQMNPVAKLLTQFQLEQNNQLSYYFKDMPRGLKGRGLAAAIAAIIKVALGAWLYNELYEKVFGRRPALDPLGILNETVGDFAGYEMPNLLDMGWGAVTGDMPSFETEQVGAYKGLKNLALAAEEELPFVGGLLGGGRLPISSAIPDLDNLHRSITDDSWSTKKRLTTLGKELLKPAAYVLAPFAGGQMKKTLEGLSAVIKGGSYTVDADGNDIMQYPIFRGEGERTLATAAQAMVLGKSSLRTAQDWVESEFKNMSAKDTATYKALTEAGVPEREAYKTVTELKNVEENYLGSKSDRQLSYIRNAELPGDAKAILFYTVASDKEKELMDAMAENEDMGQVTKLLIDMRKLSGRMAARDDITGNKADKAAMLLKADASTEAKSVIYSSFANDEERELLEKFNDERLEQTTNMLLEMAQKDIKAEKMDVIADSKFSEQEKLEIVETLWGNETETDSGNLFSYGKMETAIKEGLTLKTYNELKEEGAVTNFLKLVETMEGDDAADTALAIDALGEDPNSTEKYMAIARMPYDENIKAQAMKAIMSESAYAKYEAVQEAGVTTYEYAKFLEDTAEFEGKERQQNVWAYIDALDITTEQKDALHLTIYKESTLGKTPWH